MSIYECDFDSDVMFYDYREAVRVSDGTVRCCETGVHIPEGVPYVLCQGISACDEGEWQDYPQAIQVWRLLRNQKRTDGTCFPFEGVAEAEDDRDDWSQPARIFWLRWASLVKRLKSGAKPRLHPWEQKALASGLWYKVMEYPPNLRFTIGIPREAPDGAGWVWVDGESSQGCERHDLRHEASEPCPKCWREATGLYVVAD